MCAAWRACNVQPQEFDFLCVGSGPAGQKAAIQAAKAGFRAAIIERESQVGGSCLLSGTIPSKALREQALRYRRMQGSASSLAVELHGDAPLSALLHGVDIVIDAQDRYLQAQLARNGVELIRGRGVFWMRTASKCSAWTHRGPWCERRGYCSPRDRARGMCRPSKWTMNTFSTATPY